MLTVDSDGTIVSTGMLALIHALEATPGAAWAAGHWYHVDQHGTLLWRARTTRSSREWSDHARFGRRNSLRVGCRSCAPRRSRPTAAVREVGGSPEGTRVRAEDTALWAVLTSHFPGVWAAEHVYDHRRHPDSDTHQTGFRQMDEGLDEIAQMIAVRSTNLKQRTDCGINPSTLRSEPHRVLGTASPAKPNKTSHRPS